MPEKIDIAGRTFGDLTVVKEIERSGIGKNRHRNYICRCACGSERKYRQERLLSGASNHCIRCRWGKDSPEVRKGRQLFRQYVNGAKKRGLSFELEFDAFQSIVRKPCTYCGKFRMSRNSHTKERVTTLNGIDRVDSSIGYTLDNCLPCCTYCNQAKNSRSKDEFLQWIKDIYEFQNS